MSAAALAALLHERQPCVVLTGAGVSTESGIPDFRSPTGIWAEVDPLEVASIVAFRRDPERAVAADEEVLRCEPPVAVLGREPTETIETRGTKLEAGKMFFLSVLAANRDPEVFVEPDRFDVERAPVRSFSFGWGSHFCLGAALARAEIQETIRALACDVRSIERVGPPPRQVPFVSIRRLESFAVRIEAS